MMNTEVPYVLSEEDSRAVRSLWERFHSGLAEPSDINNPYHRFLLQEWQRCASLGADVAMTVARRLSDDELYTRTQEGKLFLETSVPIIENVGRFLNQFPGLMLLTDMTGSVLHVMGSAESRDYAAMRSGIVVGSQWDESLAGTNGIGTALSTKRPVHVFATEHFCEGLHHWSCSAAPVFDIDGQTVIGVVGVVDLATSWSDFLKQALALTVSLANAIQAQMALRRQVDHSQLPVAFSEHSGRHPREDMLAVDHADRAFQGMADRWRAGNRKRDQVVGTDVVLSPATGNTSGRIFHFSRNRPESDDGHDKAGQSPATGAPVSPPFRFGQFMSADAETIKMLRELERIALADVNVLLIGETGTGKELIARQIHAASLRKDEPYLAINCGAISPELLESTFFGYARGAFSGADPKGRAGYFETAQGGTLFLDEIGELPLCMQAALLRVLEDGSFLRVGSSTPQMSRCRIIAATHRQLDELVKQGEFRQDLYYRLKIIQRRIKPLRERSGDISILVNHFREVLEQKHHMKTTRILPSAQSLLEQYDWPGNAREVRNVIESALLSSDGTIDCEHLPPELLRTDPGKDEKHARTSPPDTNADADYERQLIIGLLRKYRKVNHVAKALGIARSTLYRKFLSLGIEQRDYADEA